MINFIFKPKDVYLDKYPTDYPYVLDYEGEFIIEVDGKIFFLEPDFSIFEFLMYIKKWINDVDSNNDMLYNSIDTEDNPLISFIYSNDRWNIHSKWQLFNCYTSFSKEELVSAIVLLEKKLTTYSRS